MSHGKNSLYITIAISKFVAQLPNILLNTLVGLPLPILPVMWWKHGQKRPMDAEEHFASNFLSESVNVNRQIKDTSTVPTQPGIVKVQYSKEPAMTRLSFLRMFVVWFAVVVLRVAILNPDPLSPNDTAVAAALDALAALPDAHAFNMAYYSHVFDTDSTDLGYYASSTPQSGLIRVSYRANIRAAARKEWSRDFQVEICRSRFSCRDCLSPPHIACTCCRSMLLIAQSAGCTRKS